MRKTKKKEVEVEVQASLIPESWPTIWSETIPIELIESLSAGADPNAELVNSIRRLGILTPIIVQKKDTSAEVYTVVDGRRRLKAALISKLAFVPCRVLDYRIENPEAFTIQSNLTRTSNPVSEFIAIRDLIAKGYSEKQIVSTLGIKSAIVTKRLSLGRLVSALFELLEAGRIAASVGEAASKLPVSLQADLIEVYLETDKLTLADVACAKRIKNSAATSKLSSLFGAEEKKRIDAKTSLSYLDALDDLTYSLGLDKVDSTCLREKLSTLIAEDVGA
jgi:ParB/RepB/Spo0J family partition protein